MKDHKEEPHGTIVIDINDEVRIEPEPEVLELTPKNVEKMMECGLNSLWFTGGMKIKVLGVNKDNRIGGKTVVLFRAKGKSDAR